MKLSVATSGATGGGARAEAVGGGGGAGLEDVGDLGGLVVGFHHGLDGCWRYYRCLRSLFVSDMCVAVTQSDTVFIIVVDW